MRTGIALGSNLADRLRNLQRARDRVFSLNQTVAPKLQSAVYETAPVDCEPGASNFYNAVIEIGFAGSSDALLRSLQEIEESLGREREHMRNVSRIIDLDLLYFGGEQRSSADLRLPHPLMTEREFVLRPLADIAPELRLPGETASIRELLARLAQGGSITCVRKGW